MARLFYVTFKKRIKSFQLIVANENTSHLYCVALIVLTDEFDCLNLFRFTIA